MVESPENQIWYLAQVKPNGDRLAERNLLRQGFGVFSPKVARTCRHRGKFREELRALFPGYLFVSVRSSIARWRAISSTLGVQKLVSFGSDSPSRISGDLIALLRQRCDERGTVQAVPLTKGNIVRIIAGPFADFVARVDSIPAEHRIWILLDIMGRGRRLSIDARDVELQAG